MADTTCKQAGRKGGQATAERYGVEHFAEIGRKGGVKVREDYGEEFLREIGAKGGRRVKALIAAGKEAMEGEGSVPFGMISRECAWRDHGRCTSREHPCFCSVDLGYCKVALCPRVRHFLRNQREAKKSVAR